MIIGDTIKLRCEFCTYLGSLVDPDTVNLNLYLGNSHTRLNEEDIVLGDEHKISAGIYEYPYTIPDVTEYIVYEFKGMVGVESIVIRGQIKISWVEQSL